MKFYCLLLMVIPVFTAAQAPSKITLELDSLFQQYFNPGEPGGAVLLVKDGNILYKKGFGVADIHTNEPVTTNTLFNVGSISKTFVAYGILKLASEYKLSLDDNLYKYFPDFKNKQIAGKVKLYHLLTHTSGIPDSRPVEEQHDFYLTAKDEENFAPLKQTDSLQFEPGTRYRYSNPAFNGLALIIEKITGEKWQDYIARTIFNPAGMKTSTITDGPHPERGVAHGYVQNKKGQFEELDYGEKPTFAAAGNGGVWSSVEELWLYEQAIQNNIFLDQQWINKSRTVYSFPAWKDPASSALGLSWFINNFMNNDMIGHTGTQGGFMADYCWLPDKKIFYVLLCNRPVPRIEIRAKLLSLFKN